LRNRVGANRAISVFHVDQLFDEANATLEDMVADGAIKPEERTRMALGSYPRRNKELLAPFVSDGHLQQMTVQDLEVSPLLDSARGQYSWTKTAKRWRRNKRCFSERSSCLRWRRRQMKFARAIA
jgi:hypothetical protein